VTSGYGMFSVRSKADGWPASPVWTKELKAKNNLHRNQVAVAIYTLKDVAILIYPDPGPSLSTSKGSPSGGEQSIWVTRICDLCQAAKQIEVVVGMKIYPLLGYVMLDGVYPSYNNRLCHPTTSVILPETRDCSSAEFGL